MILKNVVGYLTMGLTVRTRAMLCQQAVVRLQAIRWLHRVGQRDALEDMRQLCCERDCLASIGAPAWEDVALEARNEITGYLVARPIMRLLAGMHWPV